MHRALGRKKMIKREKTEKKTILSAGFPAVLCAIGFISLFSVVSVAAEKEEPQEEQARQMVELDEITVTAQKQEENVQEVPMSVSVMTDLDVEDRKIESVLDIADHVPNLLIFQQEGSGNNTPIMRGIYAPPESFLVSTGLYIDGIPEITGVGFEDKMLDIERIEVLRGPQGTLYGKGAEVGAINIITRQPDNEFRGKLSLEGGEDEKGRVSLNISGPIRKDKLFFGLSGLYYTKDGYIENTTTGDMINDREHWFGKGRLRWVPMDKLDISLVVSRLDYDEGEPDMTLGRSGAQMFMLPPPRDRKVSSNLDGWNRSSRDSQSLKIAYDLAGAFSLTSVTTHRKYLQHTFIDWDGSPVTLMHGLKDNEYDTLSQEFRLNYSSGRLKGLVGFYYDQDDTDIYMDIDYGAIVANTNRKFEGETYAVFANLTYSLTKQLSLVTGLRYETEKKEFTDNNTHINLDDSWNQLTPKVALEYSFTPENMAYVSVSQGYRAGGFNALAVSNPKYYTYDSETLWSYEIGTKNSFLDNKLIINGSVYYMDIKDMQVNEQASPEETYLTNAATAKGYGVELEAAVKVLDGMTLNGSFGYNNTEFDEFSDVLGDYDGNKNPFAPEYTYSLGGQYRHAIGFFARADLIGYGEMFFDKANKHSRGAYEIVNAKIGYEANSFDIYLYAKNLFDKEYNSYGYYGEFITVYSPPREIGAQLMYRF